MGPVNDPFGSAFGAYGWRACLAVWVAMAMHVAGVVAVLIFIAWIING
jgi:hypothetical protein